MTAVLLVLLVTLPPGSPQQPPRDAVRSPAAGTSMISGVVVTADREAQPVRRAIVTITGSSLPVSRSTISDDGGRFSFTELPAGRFTLTAARKAYLTSAFGATRPGGLGTPVRVAEGAHMADLRITLPKGAVLTGIITDPDGLPVPSLPVTVFRLTSTYTASGSDITDDRGEYRVYGLAPGDYVVACTR